MLELIEFYDCTTNKKKLRRGYKIGNYLSVIPEYEIFRVDIGKPVLPIQFRKLEDAVTFANWIDKTYRDYAILWEYPHYDDADIFSLAKWTVNDGLVFHELFELLRKTRPVIENLDHQMPDLVKTARKNAREWIYT